MIWNFSSSDARRAQRARSDFIKALRIRGKSDTDYSACEIIFGELVGNVVRHAPGPIMIRLDWTSDDAVLSVQDAGPSFVFDPSLPRDPLAESGRGLFVVAALALRVDVVALPNDGKTVHAVLPVRATSP